MSSLTTFFDRLEDPRAANVSHRLGDILVIVVAAHLCGVTTASEIALFADLRKTALNRIVAYDTAPSHDTISRLLRRLEPAALGALLAQLGAALQAQLRGTDPGKDPGVIALDGKAMRRACDAACAAHPPLTVSAFATQTRLSLGACQAGKSEVDLALDVVHMLDLAGQTVTADALHATHRMTRALQQKGAEYVLGLKQNRPAWYAEAEAAFATTPCPDLPPGGRSGCVVTAATPRAAGHHAYGRVTSRRGAEPPVTRYFLLSRSMPAAELVAITRAHWAVENSLHWVLDVHLREDHARARKDHAPANTALLKRIARNLLTAAEQTKTPISHRIQKCAFNDTYLISALAHMR